MQDQKKASLSDLGNINSQQMQCLQKEFGIYQPIDLLHFFPYRYVDKTQFYKIKDLANAPSDAQIVGKVTDIKLVNQKRGKRLVARLTDETGSMELIWFKGHQYFQKSIALHQQYVVFGKINWYKGKPSMPHPEMKLAKNFKASEKQSLDPMYSSTETFKRHGITNRKMIGWMKSALQTSNSAFIENLSNEILNHYNLMGKKEAIHQIHFPYSFDKLKYAQQRLKFEELFYMQLQFAHKHYAHKKRIKGYRFSEVGQFFNRFYKQVLPFDLTDAQKRVVKEIRKDVNSESQMNRLLQGDVGSGKTIVAFLAMLLAKDNAFQSCLMAPTEILAQQHFATLMDLGEKIDVDIKLLTGSTPQSARKQIHERLLNGEIDILIGTHAVLEDIVQFKNLGFVVIDEQHRFGVAQRAKLWGKNKLPPHILVMTATPIPRTLAMSVYGDLSVSVIDELPPGRKPVKTIHRYDSSRLQVFNFLKQQIAEGRQVYIVYPLIEESDNFDYKDLIDGYESIEREFPKPDYQIAIVHGKMKPDDKAYEMQRFVKGNTQIMVATTVIEVGVNVPNASVMVIESSERFGLAQLHQLRGRVGRGAAKSYCILMSSLKLSNEAKARIKTMTATNDGFKIAEKDMELRGPGDMMGTQQSGIVNLKIADIQADQGILKHAKNAAFWVIQQDIDLQEPKHQMIAKAFHQLMKKQYFWNYIS
jgi:ATP-dependent DNA helicase RecG